MSESARESRLGDRFAEALAFAARLHVGQVRKASEVPYVAHLLAVAGLALEHGADEDEAIGALLHDAIEDQGGERTRAEIERRFGERVAKLVLALSDSTADTSQGAEKEPWKIRKHRYLEQISRADRSARLVAACDKLHNLRSLVDDYRRLGEKLWDHFSAGRDEQLPLYRATIEALAPGNDPRLMEALRRTLAELEALAERSSGES